MYIRPDGLKEIGEKSATDLQDIPFGINRELADVKMRLATFSRSNPGEFEEMSPQSIIICDA